MFLKPIKKNTCPLIKSPKPHFQSHPIKAVEQACTKHSTDPGALTGVLFTVTSMKCAINTQKSPKLQAGEMQQEDK